jgi:hypothetical protein
MAQVERNTPIERQFQWLVGYVSSDDNDDDLLFMMANLMTMVMTGCL